MRIKLEYDDGPVFSTMQVASWQKYRTLLVRINGKAFTVWRTLDPHETAYYHDDKYIEEIDKVLVAEMERMLGKLFMDACAAVPEGTELLP